MNVVISYCQADEKLANRIAGDLEISRINPWIDKKSLADSSVWLREIDKALTAADYVLGIITAKYLNSMGALEGFATVAADQRRNTKKFIPLFFQDPDSLQSTIIPAI